jgi:3-oxoacyl-[acyl-carrier-protein] synthase III
LAALSFSGVGISALSAAVPSVIIENYQYIDHFSAAIAKEITDKTGIKQRRFAPPQMCASDLAYAAADKLLNDQSIDRPEVGAIIFVSQTPDYRMPATAILLQERLGLPHSAMAFDISLGCSGFVYGLSVAYALAQSGLGKHVLLVNGETRSRVYSPKDRQVAFLFGDAGSAALISKAPEFGESYFLLMNDGSRQDYIKMDSGGYRQPTSAETLVERVVDADGNKRSQEHGYIKGADVFGFVLSHIPGHIKSLIESSGLSLQEIDYAFLHQANAFLNAQVVRKIGLSANQAPISLDRFGNTSSVSIPLTMVATQADWKKNAQRVLLSGFGVGMSWGSAIINVSRTAVSELVEI